MVTVVEHSRNSSIFDKYTRYEEPDNGIVPMHKEANRLKTYRNWPCEFMEPTSLAKAGFYYVNKDDIVRCAFCNIEIGQWEQGDDAMADHQRWSENCPFIRGHSCGNIPVEIDSVPIASTGHDTCGKYGVEVRPNSMPETSAANLLAKEFDFHKLGLPPYRGPLYTEYVTLDRRLSSFASWPRSIKQKPNELAAAGFFYNGKGDQTICFHCGGGLKDWEDDDVPWEQHAKWFSKCNFVWLQKGPEYISEIGSKQQAVLTPDETSELQTTSANSSSTNPVKREIDLNSASASNATISSISKSKENETKELVSEDEDETSSKNLCKICYVKERGVLFFPCRHMIACIDCAPALSTCVVCREPFQAVTRVFLP